MPQLFEFNEQSICRPHDLSATSVKLLAVVEDQKYVLLEELLRSVLVAHRLSHEQVRTHAIHEGVDVHWVVNHAAVLFVHVLAHALLSDRLQKVSRLTMVEEHTQYVPTALHNGIVVFFIGERIDYRLIVVNGRLVTCFRRWLRVITANVRALRNIRMHDIVV